VRLQRFTPFPTLEQAHYLAVLVDLIPGINLDAPTLWRLAASDFTAETAVEFRPVEHYQGAGLFARQDARNFVRLERCISGLGAGGSGICFLKVTNGEPEVIADGNTVATEARRVELRLRSSGGDKIAAWWRDAAAGPASPWREVGSTTLRLRPTPQAGLATGIRVGILLVVEGGSEISADFDWFRLGK
jgi:beta-xylosidase